MIGPDRGMKGGIASVVNGYFDAGLADICGLRYIGTMVEGSKARKLVKAAFALVQFECALPSCDLVHVHMASWGSYERKRRFIACAKHAGKPYIIHMHGGKWGEFFSGCSDSKRHEIRGVFASAARVIVLSEEWKSYFEKNVCESSKLLVLHNAVRVHDKSVLTGIGSSVRRDILFLGRLDANKSPDVLLRAFVDVARRHPGVMVRFGGDGNVERYRKLAEELGITSNCEFLGWVGEDERERLFAKSGIYCLPSKNEGMPMSVLEAMDHGLATIATSVGGIPEIIDDKVDGFLIPVDGSEDLARALNALLSNNELRFRVGESGRTKIENHFNIEKNINMLHGIYEQLVG